MSDLVLTIIAPAHGTAFKSSDGNIPLQAQLVGDSSGLLFKWYSSLNSNADENQPELNSVSALNSQAALPEFGSHILTLAATDHADPIQVTRSSMAGGAPPTAENPCVIHRLKAEIRTPDSNSANLSRSTPVIEVLAPLRLAKEDPVGSNNWVKDTDYLAINGIAISLHFAAQGTASPNAEKSLDLTSTTHFRADDATWLRYTAALPNNLQNGNHVLTLEVSAGGKTEQATRNVVLVN